MTSTEDSVFNFSKSNLILKVGGQILLLILMFMILFFGVEPITFPANQVRNMVARMNPNGK
jgi:hypothetical protein